MAKSSAANKLSNTRARAVAQAVLEAVAPVLPDKYYLLAVDFEKEMGYWFLRLYVAGRGFRMSLGDCETISRQIDPLLEALPELQGVTEAYSVEVSSPGSFRPLKTVREMEFYRGESVKLVKHLPHDPKARKPKVLEAIEGVLESFDEVAGTVVLRRPEAPEPLKVSLISGDDGEYAVYLNPETILPEDDSLA